MKRVDRAQAKLYLEKARGFLGDAENMIGQSEFSGNGVAVLAIHAAIAFADAVTIRIREAKSASGDHTEAVDVLQDSLGRLTDSDRVALKDLRFILQRKNDASYTANLVSTQEAEAIVAKLRSFARWAEARYLSL